MTYQGFPSVEAYVAFLVDTLTRREGDVVTFEVMDKLDPAQRESAIVLVEPCACGLTPAHTDAPYCQCGAATKAQALTTELRRQYATQIDLRAGVRA